MSTLIIPIVRPDCVEIDIDPETVEVHGHRFFARTVDGMTVSISLAEHAHIPLIEVLATSKDNSKPPTIVGEAPPYLYHELLRGALGVSPTPQAKKWKPQPDGRNESTKTSIRVNGSEVSARLSTKSDATDSARRLLAKLTGLGRAPS